MISTDLNHISATLAKMTPQQRQQYAAMHKNDPNAAMVISLAKFITDTENAKRQHMMNSQAAMQGPQPKVVDQAIASMAPQDAGIAALPANVNPPETGIAAPDEGYADGGVVHFQTGGATGSWDEEPKGALGWLKGLGQGLMHPGVMPPTAGTQRPTASPEDIERAVQAFKQTSESYGDPVTPDEEAAYRAKLAADPQEAMRFVPRPQPVPQPQAAPAAAPAQEQPAYRMRIDGVGQGPEAKPAAPAASGIAALPSAPALPGRAGLMSTDVPSIDVEGIYNRQFAGQGDRLEGILGARKDLSEQRVKDARDNEADVRREQDELGQYGAEREKKLKERGKRLDDAEGRNGAMALIDAGLAMMAGESQHALVNIGKGAQVGMQRFREGKEKIDAARERLDDAFALLEDLRRNEKRMNQKELREARNVTRGAIQQGMSDLIDGAKMAFDVDQKKAETIFAGVIQDRTGQRNAAVEIGKANLQASTSMRNTDVAAGASMHNARVGAAASLAGANARANAKEGMTDYQKAQLMMNVNKWIDDSVKAQRESSPAGMMSPLQERQLRARLMEQARTTVPGLAELLPPSSSGAGNGLLNLDPSQFKVIPQ